MRTLYIDCSAGISGDMLLAGLKEIAEKAGVNAPEPELFAGSADGSRGDHNHADHGDHHDRNAHANNEHANHNGEHEHHHGRSYSEVKDIITGAVAGEEAKAIALSIYAAIAKAEAQVHEKTLQTVHFHEVGRDQAIKNALGIGAVLEALGTDGAGQRVEGRVRTEKTTGIEEHFRLEILTSPICDGTGFIDCAHGRIPVPVPAVQAMKNQCPDYSFETAEEVKTEMVTPSGLAALIGIGAKAAKDGWNAGKEAVAFAEVKGTRDTGRGGLKLCLFR